MDIGDIPGWLQVVLGLLVIPTVAWWSRRRRNRRITAEQARSARAAAREQERQSRRADVSVVYEQPEPGSGKFGQLVLVNNGLAPARNIRWWIVDDGRPGSPAVFTEAFTGPCTG
jgi:type II secretory pathway pseudopilin PulG